MPTATVTGINMQCMTVSANMLLDTVTVHNKNKQANRKTKQQKQAVLLASLHVKLVCFVPGSVELGPLCLACRRVSQAGGVPCRPIELGVLIQKPHAAKDGMKVLHTDMTNDNQLSLPYTKNKHTFESCVNACVCML